VRLRLWCAYGFGALTALVRLRLWCAYGFGALAALARLRLWCACGFGCAYGFGALMGLVRLRLWCACGFDALTLRAAYGSGGLPTPLRRGCRLPCGSRWLPQSAPARFAPPCDLRSGGLPTLRSGAACASVRFTAPTPVRLTTPVRSRLRALTTPVRSRPPGANSRFCARLLRLYVAIPNPKKSWRGLGVLRVLAATKPPPGAPTYSGLAKTFLSPSPSGPSSRFWMGLRPGMTIATRQCPSSLTHLVS
jgi:hypothetical protein